MSVTVFGSVRGIQRNMRYALTGLREATGIKLRRAKRKREREQERRARGKAPIEWAQLAARKRRGLFGRMADACRRFVGRGKR